MNNENDPSISFNDDELRDFLDQSTKEIEKTDFDRLRCEALVDEITQHAIECNLPALASPRGEINDAWRDQYAADAERMLREHPAMSSLSETQIELHVYQILADRLMTEGLIFSMIFLAKATAQGEGSEGQDIDLRRIKLDTMARALYKLDEDLDDSAWADFINREIPGPAIGSEYEQQLALIQMELYANEESQSAESNHRIQQAYERSGLDYEASPGMIMQLVHAAAAYDSDVERDSRTDEIARTYSIDPACARAFVAGYRDSPDA